jgi:hypothetical protein
MKNGNFGGNSDGNFFGKFPGNLDGNFWKLKTSN